MPAVGVASEFAPKPTRRRAAGATQGTDSGNDRTRTFARDANGVRFPSANF
jgi:hypothetical protein